MKAKISNLTAELEISSEASLITSVLESLPNGRILIHGDPVGRLAEVESYVVKNFGSAISPKVVEAFDLSKSGTRFKVFRAGSVLDEDNIAILAEKSTITFGSFGDFVTTLLNGDYVAPDLVENIAASQTAIVPNMTVNGQDQVVASFGGSLSFYDAEEIEVTSVNVDPDQDFGVLQTALAGAGITATKDGISVRVTKNGNDLVRVEFEGTSENFVNTVGGSFTRVANGILLDQIAKTLSVVDVTSFTGVDPVAAEGAKLVDVARAVESGSFFE